MALNVGSRLGHYDVTEEEKQFWRRHHHTGWMGIVGLDSAGSFSACAVHGDDWQHRSVPERCIADLVTAQDRADIAVQAKEPHACGLCGSWPKQSAGLLSDLPRDRWPK